MDYDIKQKVFTGEVRWVQVHFIIIISFHCTFRKMQEKKLTKLSPLHALSTKQAPWHTSRAERLKGGGEKKQILIFAMRLNAKKKLRFVM